MAARAGLFAVGVAVWRSVPARPVAREAAPAMGSMRPDCGVLPCLYISCPLFSFVPGCHGPPS